MKIIYKPEDGSTPEEMTFRVGRIKRSEASEVEKRYGQPMEAMWMDLWDGSSDAIAMAFYLCRKAGNPKYRFDDLPDYSMDEIETVKESYDVKRMMARSDKAQGVDPKTKAERMGRLQEVLDILEAEEGKAPAEESTPS